LKPVYVGDEVEIEIIELEKDEGKLHNYSCRGEVNHVAVIDGIAKLMI